MWCFGPWMNHLSPVWLSSFKFIFLSDSWCVSLVQWREILHRFLAFIHAFIHYPSFAYEWNRKFIPSWFTHSLASKPTHAFIQSFMRIFMTVLNGHENYHGFWGRGRGNPVKSVKETSWYIRVEVSISYHGCCMKYLLAKHNCTAIHIWSLIQGWCLNRCQFLDIDDDWNFG